MSDPRQENENERNATPGDEEERAAEAPAEREQEAPGDAETPAREAETTADAVGVLEAEVAELKERLMRAVAETENVRRRSERDREDAQKFAVTKFARDVLAVPDNLERALAAVPEEARRNDEAVKALIDGVEMTHRELMNILERHGIRRVEPKGEKFDPNLHQAMFEVPGTGEPNGTVVEVVQSGYVIGERLLRPALVGVAKGGTSGEAKAEQASGGADDGG